MDRKRADRIGGRDRRVRRLIISYEEELYGAEVRQWTMGAGRIFG